LSRAVASLRPSLLLIAARLELFVCSNHTRQQVLPSVRMVTEEKTGDFAAGYGNCAPAGPGDGIYDEKQAP
jgi:hypothetical protein